MADESPGTAVTFDGGSARLQHGEYGPTTAALLYVEPFVTVESVNVYWNPFVRFENVHESPDVQQ